MLQIETQRDLGDYIRRDVLPQGLPVKQAAERLGIGRPALSNFLNGKAALSADMAARLERAFGADGRALLELQAEIDRPARDTSERALTVRRYVPNFLVIRAAQIDQWPENNLDARQHLPVLLRRLVHSTGEGQDRLPVFTFVKAGVSPARIVAALDDAGVAVRAGDMAALPLLRRFGVDSAVRASCYLYTTAAEIDRLADVVLRTR